MNEINDYLEAMFSPYPQSPRLHEAKAELQGVTEDAYGGHIAQGATPNEAMVQIVTDLGNLDELAPTLGIAADLASCGGAQTRKLDRV